MIIKDLNPCIFQPYPPSKWPSSQGYIPFKVVPGAPDIMNYSEHLPGVFFLRFLRLISGLKEIMGVMHGT